MSYLLDTTWVVAHLRGSADVSARIRELVEDGLALSIVSIAELFEGVFRSARPAANEESLVDFLNDVTVLDVDYATARTYGQLRAELVQHGTALAPLDSLIAATALSHDLTLLTFDGDFRRVPGLRVVTA